MTIEAGDISGVVTAKLGATEDGKYLTVLSQEEAPNPANEAISDTGIAMKLHWRAHVNDMNKRMGELRDANGEHGVWTRMVRGESEYKNTKAQYNQYQLGYDEKLSVDKRWTVGAAVTFSEGDASYGYGSTEDKSTAFAIYGSKLNNDGTFVDLIARYAHLESDVDDQAGKGSYSANGMSVSAEFGKRIQQGNGLWIEPQAELTYGTIDSAEYKLGTKIVEVGDMDSLIGRLASELAKTLKKVMFMLAHPICMISKAKLKTHSEMILQEEASTKTSVAVGGKLA
jgi:outer membrane autotransporter protein